MKAGMKMEANVAIEADAAIEVDRAAEADRAAGEAQVTASAGGHRLRSRLQDAAVRDAWLAFCGSRLVIWLAGTYAILAVGYRPTGGAPHTGAPFGNLGELLFGQADRWDAAYYLSIAGHAYSGAKTAAFFPLYPLSVAGLGAILTSTLIAGIAVSLAGFAIGLYLLHRLVALELGERHSRTAVLVLAFFPTSLFFSAIYAEGLLLALTIAAVYAARTGRWAWAGGLGALAASTHNSGVLVVIPIVLLYLYGPRADRPPDRVAARRTRDWRPRYRVRLDVLWALLVPLGLLAFLLYMGVEFGDALRPLHVNSSVWHRHFVLLGGLTQLPHALWHELQTIGEATPGRLFPATNGAYRSAASNMLDFSALVLAVAATVGAVRHLPAAYSAYTIAALVVFTSAPKRLEPLLSLPRFILLLFPLQMAIARWLDQSPSRRNIWLTCSGAALGALAMQFATGRWVA